MRFISFALMWPLALAAAPVAPQPSPACKPVIDATHRQSTTPNHQIVVQSGHANAEVISLSDATYVKFPQGWIKTGPGFADDRPDQKDNLPKVYECRRLPDAALDGVAASVFAVHTEDNAAASDETIWIAKATGLPMRADGDTTKRSKKVHVSTTWSYDNIRAPVLK